MYKLPQHTHWLQTACSVCSTVIIPIKPAGARHHAHEMLGNFGQAFHPRLMHTSQCIGFCSPVVLLGVIKAQTAPARAGATRALRLSEASSTPLHGHLERSQ